MTTELAVVVRQSDFLRMEVAWRKIRACDGACLCAYCDSEIASGEARLAILVGPDDDDPMLEYVHLHCASEIVGCDVNERRSK